MSFASLLTQDVTLYEPGTPTTDDFGDDQPGSPSPTTAKGLIQPITSAEDIINRDTAVTRWRLFLPPDVTVDRLTRVSDGTDTYDVLGEPELYRTPSGPHHYEVTLQRVTG